MKTRVAALAAVFLLSLNGCAATLREAGTQEVSWTSAASRPDWTGNGAPYFRKDGKIFFVGVSTDIGSQQNARLHAKANAIRTMTEGVRLITKTWLADSVHGADDASQGSFLKAGVAAVSSVVDVQGLMPASEYAEKVRTWDGGQWNHTWNVYGLYELREAEYLDARKRAMEGLRTQARKANDKKAEQMAEEALKKLDTFVEPQQEVTDGTQPLVAIP